MRITAKAAKSLRRTLLLALFLYLSSPGFCISLVGRVHEYGSPYPVPGAIIRVPGSTTYAESEAEGRFKLEVPAGTATVFISAPGYRTKELGLTEEKTDNLKIALVRVEVRADEVVVRGRREALQASQTEISREEIKSTPGTAGDALRAVQNMPGVSMVNDMLGQMTVRGGGPYDNLYLIDAIPWPVPFHFGGIMSTVNSELLRGVDLYAAGFDSRWGDVHGAVLDAHTRPGAKDRVQATADLNLVVSEGLLEGPLGLGDASWTIGGRRSYYDLIFGRMFKDTFTAFPRFWDLGGSFDASLSSQDRIRGLALATDDTLGLKISQDMTRDSGFSGTFHMNNTYETGGVSWTSTRIPGVTSVLTPYAYDVSYDMGMGDIFGLDNRSRYLGIKEEASWEAGRLLGVQHTIGFGGELVQVRDYFTLHFDSPRPGEDTYDTTVEGKGLNSGAWLQDRVQASEKTAVTAGGRFDHSDRVKDSVVLPRASAEYKADPATTLRMAWGIYSRFPDGMQLNPDYGNPDLGPEYAQHTVLGVERQLSPGFFGRVEVYHKWYYNLVVGRQGTITIGDRAEGNRGDNNYTNDGTGLARGIEFFLKRNLGEKFFGWISYAYSVSKRHEGPGAGWTRYEYDQPHVATMVASYAPSTNWRVGTKVRYNSGPLVTPVTGRYQDASGDWHAIYGTPYSRQLADYIRVDLRAERTFRYFDWNLKFYIEGLNLFSRKNPTGLEYNKDYSQERIVGSLPRILYFGLEAKL